jgi:hypothetical protein
VNHFAAEPPLSRRRVAFTLQNYLTSFQADHFTQIIPRAGTIHTAEHSSTCTTEQRTPVLEAMITWCHYQEAKAWPEGAIDFPAGTNEEMKSHSENSSLAGSSAGQGRW